MVFLFRVVFIRYDEWVKKKRPGDYFYRMYTGVKMSAHPTTTGGLSSSGG